MLTKVDISFYKPEGFGNAWVVETEDRGKAIRRVLSQYPDDMHRYLNLLFATPVSDDYDKSHHVRRLTSE